MKRSASPSIVLTSVRRSIGLTSVRRSIVLTSVRRSCPPVRQSLPRCFSRTWKRKTPAKLKSKTSCRPNILAIFWSRSFHRTTSYRIVINQINIFFIQIDKLNEINFKPKTCLTSPNWRIGFKLCHFCRPVSVRFCIVLKFHLLNVFYLPTVMDSNA